MDLFRTQTSKKPASSAAASSVRFSTKELTLAGMFAAVLAVISQISLPTPSGIPITLQVFGAALTGVVLGWRLGACSVLVYILTGAVGLPVFSGFRGGLSSLVGLTGGYIWSFPVLALLCGIAPKTKQKSLRFTVRILLALLGLFIVETIGGLQWAALSEELSFSAIVSYSLAAFVPKDILLTVLAVFLGTPVRNMLLRMR